MPTVGDRHLPLLLKEYHEHFCLEENERGDSNLRLTPGMLPPVLT